jgi:hypothetical protein
MGVLLDRVRMKVEVNIPLKHLKTLEKSGIQRKKTGVLVPYYKKY